MKSIMGVQINSSNRVKLILAFGAIWIIWGSTYLAIRYALEGFPPYLMASLRFLVAGTLLYAMGARQGAPRATKQYIWPSIVLGALFFVGGNASVVWAEQHIASSHAALLIGVEPFFIVLLQGILPRGWLLLGLLLGVSGIAFLIGPQQLAEGGPIHLGGALAVLGGCLAWAAGSLYGRKAIMPTNALQSASLPMLAGGVLLAVLSLSFGERLEIDALTLRPVLALLYLIVFGSMITFTAYHWLVRVASPTMVSTYAFINPVVAVLLGWLIGGEALESRTWIAAIMIVSAVALLTLKSPEKK